ncbi:uncharacterized protein LOC118512914 [Anopheles stephensi]|uniref:uncharacterized protein LOC118512914 n=1 Tax=Anopheles stephensi TaxID=30069 RepID=UPI00165875FF|nr:uncharacterized protein LOC118512914 [Anopheles stephensi]
MGELQKTKRNSFCPPIHGGRPLGNVAPPPLREYMNEHDPVVCWADFSGFAGAHYCQQCALVSFPGRRSVEDRSHRVASCQHQQASPRASDAKEEEKGKRINAAGNWRPRVLVCFFFLLIQCFNPDVQERLDVAVEKIVTNKTRFYSTKLIPSSLDCHLCYAANEDPQHTSAVQSERNQNMMAGGVY